MMKKSSKQYGVSSRSWILLLGIFMLATYYLLPTTTYSQTVDLLWQGETYTRPFYKGKSLWSRQSRITLVAIPQGLGNAANLNYRWTKNGTILGNINGVGRNTLSFTDTILSRAQTIQVEIVGSSGEILAGTSVFVSPTTPRLLVYENNPLYGFMFHRAVGDSYELEEGEVTFGAFPFFFSATSRLGQNINYEWRTNTGGVETAGSATYRAPEDTVGSSRIEVRVANEEKVAQTGGKSFLIEFGNQ